ncbi:AAA family ATPase [Mycolicibacterium aichiense]|uniref:AAA family ATPase n=1 Tax=Mycolicibacterium aichiense TaxID=1799 RepID=UPI003D67F198
MSDTQGRNGFDQSDDDPFCETSDDECSSWAPVDMRTAMAGGEILPDIGTRDDGAPMLYAGRVHVFFGSFESGKTFAALYFVAQELNRGQNVLYIDFEDSGRGIGWRLNQLGVELDVIYNRDRFAYIRPDESLRSNSAATHFDSLLEGKYSLAVIDGVTESISLENLKDSSGSDIALWQSRFPRRIARETGAATICLDHVPKDLDNRAMPTGSQHKMSGIDGVAYSFTCDQKIGKGKIGRVFMRVHKDRSGGVRGPLGSDYNAKDQSALVGLFVLDARNATNYAARIEVPSGQIGSQSSVVIAESHSNAHEKLDFCRERLTEYISKSLPDDQRSGRAIVSALQSVKFRKKTVGEQHWRNALQSLIDEHYVFTEDGPRKSKLHFKSEMFVAGCGGSDEQRGKRKVAVERARRVRQVELARAKVAEMNDLDSQ